MRVLAHVGTRQREKKREKGKPRVVDESSSRFDFSKIVSDFFAEILVSKQSRINF